MSSEAPGGVAGAADGVRGQVMAAAVACAEESGVGSFSLEDVATRAGVSRTTIYRHFPGGREQLVEETAVHEIARFWQRVAEAVQELPTLEERLVSALVIGRKLMQRSRILDSLIEPELSELIAAVRPSEPLIHAVIRDFVRAQLSLEVDQGRVRRDVDPDVAADYLTRMLLSWLGSPAGHDLTDPVVARRIVRREFLAGLRTVG